MRAGLLRGSTNCNRDRAAGGVSRPEGVEKGMRVSTPRADTDGVGQGLWGLIPALLLQGLLKTADVFQMILASH